MIDTRRIDNHLDTTRLKQAHVAIFGIGGSMTKAEGLVRCGISKLTLFDFDRVEASNVARQGHEQIGLLKVEAAARRLKQINPDVHVVPVPIDITTVDDNTADQLLADVDLLIFTVDQFAADAWGNRQALRLKKKAMWVGIYREAGAAEIVWWHPGIDACFRCLMEHRYAQQQQARQEGRRLDPPSDGTLFQDLMVVDGIAGQIALGLLTMGVDNYFGNLVATLADRNFLQVKLRHNWQLRGGDPVRRVLGVDPQNDAYFCWNTVVRRDGRTTTPCADCAQYRGHTFRAVPGSDPLIYERIKPLDAERESPRQQDLMEGQGGL